jgi:hypothetical protein
MISAGRCHGNEVSFPDRPPAGSNPWEWYWDLMADRGVYLYATKFADAKRGLTAWNKDGGAVISLDYRLNAAQRRVTLAHELHHLAIGGICETYCPANEKLVITETARWLLPDIEQVAHLLRKGSVGSTAAKLKVNTGLIFERLDAVTAKERKVLDAVMGQGPNWVPEAMIARPSAMVAAAVSGKLR